MSFSLNRLTQLAPEDRLAYVQEHEAEVAELTDRQKDRVGTLLCHASPKDVREERPIISDLRANKAQETFERLAPSQGVDKAQEFAIGKAHVSKTTQRA